MQYTVEYNDYETMIVINFSVRIKSCFLVTCCHKDSNK